MTTKFIYDVMAFWNEKVRGNTKENSIVKTSALTIIAADFIHELKHRLGFQLRLEYPNSTLQFPLPNRWSNPDASLSKQQRHMVIKQVGINLKLAGQKEVKKVNEDADRSRGAINIMGLFGTIHLGQIDNIKLVAQKFSALSEVTYIPERELLFADSLINGQIAYMIRKYGVEYYEIPQSKAIDEDYRKSFEEALKNSDWNENSSKFGLTQEDIIQRISKNQGVYTHLYEHLQKESQGDVMEVRPTIYCDNQELDLIHYMHIPYPIFLKVNAGFICIAVGIRIKKKVKIFSPFFQSQGERIWRLVQSHLAQAATNDFSVRTHLGIFHFTSNQYNVPLYRCLGLLKDKKDKENFKSFIDHSYGMFSRGLEGVNVAATASLVNPVRKYSLVNKALNLSQENSINIIAGTSNNLKIYDFNPRGILKNHGISDEEVVQNFPKINFDFQLYQILSEYVEGLYKVYDVAKIEDHLFEQINRQTKHMGVGEGSTPRPGLRSKEDVLLTLKNLCFIWVGFHSHTFSVISTASYALFRPAMLKRRIPENQTEWQNIEVSDELADSKTLLETGKLLEATTQRDPDNYLMDQIRRQAQFAGYHASQQRSNKELCQIYQNFQKVALKTFKSLQKYQEKILLLNRQRKEQRNLISLEWMVPSMIQSSLNI